MLIGSIIIVSVEQLARILIVEPIGGIERFLHFLE